MKRFGVLGVAFIALFGATVVAAAASPSASPSASPRPSATPHASATPKPSATPRPSATPKPSASPAATPKPSASPSASPAGSGETTFNAPVDPLQITGAATVVVHPDGTGDVTLKVSGLTDASTWAVDIDGGTIARPDESREIAFKTGADLTRLAMDTVLIHLSKPEMAAFMSAHRDGGVVAEVSDGIRVGYAQFGT